MQLKSESDILLPGFRKQVIEEILGPENQNRRNDAFKRYEALKDQTDYYVYDLLMQQFDPTTVNEMQYAVTNISITRKVIDKLARVYNSGVKRTLENEADTDTVEIMAQRLHFNTKMKKLNRYLKLFRNALAFPAPIKTLVGDQEKWDIKLNILAPYLYDVIEDPNNPEEPAVIILSDFSPSRQALYALDAAKAGRSRNGTGQVLQIRGDNKNQIIADEPTDNKTGQFIWWSKSFHFTTDAKGEIVGGVGPNDISNPILALPFVSFAFDQDGAYWAKGGGDLVESAIKINALLTHINHIAVIQGYGQLYMTGKNLPKSVKVGPNHCIQLEHEKEDPDPKVGFLTANPPIADLKSLVEMYVALLLSTNNLSTSGFAASLQGSQDFASGIALLIDKSESVEDVQDQAQLFRDKEPKIWDLISKWHEVYKAKQGLVDELQMLQPFDATGMTVTFADAQTILSEAEKLDIIQKRMEMGLNTMVELIMRDDPSLDEQAAEAKLEKIRAEKESRMADAMDAALSADPGQAGKDPMKGEVSNDQENQDQGQGKDQGQG